MKSMKSTIANALAVMLLLMGPFIAYGQDSASAPPSPDQLLQQMSKGLKDAKNLRFHAEINFDDVLISGQKIQYAGAVDVTLSRPNGVYIDYRDDLSAKRFWYDGKTGTLLDVAQEKYSKVNLPSDIDAAINQLQQRYALTLPLAELLSSDFFAILDEIALAWGYIGVDDVGGTPTHHIAIVCEDTDLQLWIQKDGPPLLLKFVVTYKNIPQSPQYQAILMDWNLEAKTSSSSFEPVLPKSATQIDFLTAEGTQ